MNQDLMHLRLLSNFHYVVAGIMVLYSCMPFLLENGGLALMAPPKADRFGQVATLVLTSFFMLAGWAIAAGIVVAGRFLGRRRHYVFCMVMAAIMCMVPPFITVLGVFTIIVLLRPSVKLLFDQPSNVQAL
jgi:hypothetical protein